MSVTPLEDDEPVMARGDGYGYGTHAGDGEGNGDVAAEREHDIDLAWHWLLFGAGETDGGTRSGRRRLMDFDQPIATPVVFMTIDEGGD